MIAQILTRRAAFAALVGWALALAATACGGSSGDKAGGGSSEKPLVLTLESEDDLSLTGAPEFAAAVERLSGGRVRIDIVPAGRGTEAEFEKGVVQDVRDGKAQLGIGDARVWDTLGVRSFQPLVAPFLVDSLELERRVLESPLATRMLEGVEQAGVVGIALLPGPLRRPFGLSRPLVRPDDYAGATIGTRPAGLARTALRALGAKTKGYVPGLLSGLDGTDMDPKSIDYNGWEGALTINVVLWPKPYTIFMNRDAFDALTSEQQEILRDAGREALASELDDLVRGGSDALSKACADGALALVSASAADRAALRKAVQPVYEELESDPDTEKLIGEIAEMRSAAPAAAATALPRCRRALGSATVGAGALEGRWKLTFTPDDLVAVGIPRKSLRKDLPAIVHAIVTFAPNGRYTGTANGSVVARATYTVRGDVVSLVFDPPVPVGYVAGHVYRMRWNVYRDTLTFSRVTGSDWDGVLLTNPLTRIR
jgi:TRAP-type C4-dicarboxylate transport system substrate-binding protein